MPRDDVHDYPRPRQSGKAVASLIGSLAGLVGCLFVGPVAGLVLGYQATRDIRASQGRLTGQAFATAGIVIGWFGIARDLLISGAVAVLWLYDIFWVRAMQDLNLMP